MGAVIGFGALLAGARDGSALTVFPGSDIGAFDPGLAKRLATVRAASGEFALAPAAASALQNGSFSLQNQGFVREAIAGTYGRSIGYAAIQRALENRPNGEAAGSFLSDADLDGAAAWPVLGSAERG